MDNQALEAVRESIAERKQALADSKKNNDGRSESIQAKIHELEVHRKKTIALGGHSRGFRDQIDTWRSNITSNINRAKKKLAEAKLLRLAQHFDVSISSESGSFVYRPAGHDFQWQTEKPQK